MRVWKVQGGNPLNGEVKIQGSKNAVLPIMAASIIAPCETVLYNCPKLSDVDAAIKILQHLGCTVERDKDKIYINSYGILKTDIPHELMREMRSSVIFLGAILAREKMAKLYTPGGCELGARPIDLHISALKALGAKVEEQGGALICKEARLFGTCINLDFPSVGATENAMLAACGAFGKTIITNSAREPEIVDLGNFLLKLGANISGLGTSTIKIDGFAPHAFVEYKIMSDRIVAATALCGTALCSGDVFLRDVAPKDFEAISLKLEQMGCDIKKSNDSIRIKATKALNAPKPIVTKPYPAFPTDAQPLLMAACLKAKGTTVFTENIFENRYRHASELTRMGADISIVGRVAVVTGVGNLHGAPVTAEDLRGGAALLTAALGAFGETKIYDTGHIERGYEGLDIMFNGLGGNITKAIC